MKDFDIPFGRQQMILDRGKIKINIRAFPLVGFSLKTEASFQQLMILWQ